MFLTWKQCAVSGCRSFISECKWEQISLTRNSRSLFSLVPSRHSRQHLCCHFAFAVLPMSAVAAVWTRPTPRSSGKITCVIPKLGLALRFFIYRQCGQYCHNLFSFGNWSLTWNTASIQHYRCRSYMFRHGTWGIWQTWAERLSLCYLPYGVKRSVVHTVLVYQYLTLFTCKNFRAVYRYQTNRQGSLLLGVSEGGIQSCLLFERSLKHQKRSFGGHVTVNLSIIGLNHPEISS